MKCEQFEELLDRCFDEQSGFSVSDEMKAHMAECASCRNLYALKKALPLMNDSKDEELPEGVSGILEKAIRRDNVIDIGNADEQQPAKKSPVWIRWASAAAAVLVLAAGVTVLTRNGVQSPDKVPVTKTISSDSAASGSVPGSSAAGQDGAQKSRSASGNGSMEAASVVTQMPMPAATGMPKTASAPAPAEMYLSAEMPIAEPGSFADESAADTTDFMLAEEAPMAAAAEAVWDMAAAEECAPSEVFSSVEESAPALLADLTRETSDTDRDMDDIRELAAACGGKIKSHRTDNITSGDSSWATLITLRVPESGLDTFLSGMTDRGYRITRDESMPYTDSTEELNGVPYIILTVILLEVQ